jgi:hypothetical protein
MHLGQHSLKSKHPADAGGADDMHKPPTASNAAKIL